MGSDKRMDKLKYRVWVNEQMIYPDSEKKTYEWLIDQSGNLHPFPNSLDITFDPVALEGAVYMRRTGWTDTSHNYDIYESDVVRDHDGYIGLVVWRPERGAWELSYRSESLAMDEFPQKGSLTVLGNTYQHPDWENWGTDRETP